MGLFFFEGVEHLGLLNGPVLLPYKQRPIKSPKSIFSDFFLTPSPVLQTLHQHRVHTECRERERERRRNGKKEWRRRNRNGKIRIGCIANRVRELWRWTPSTPCHVPCWPRTQWTLLHLHLPLLRLSLAPTFFPGTLYFHFYWVSFKTKNFSLTHSVIRLVFFLYVGLGFSQWEVCGDGGV